MVNTYDVCKNCGGQRGLHHYETDQCPVGGREAPVGRRQEWKSTTFELDKSDDLVELRETVKRLSERIDELEDIVERMHSESEIEESVRIYGTGE